MAAGGSWEHLFLLLFLLLTSYLNLAQAKGTKYVTCGSVLKLLNTDYKVRLHSHDIKYGTGSGQQSVTGTEAKEDGNSHWLIKAETGKECGRGKPIKCGDVIRLEHVATRKNLHSHHVSSPLSSKQEVSAYGDSRGEGDSGDHWVVVCDSDFWERDDSVMFQHVDTDTYLSVTGRQYGSPIVGQIEVAGEYSPYNAQWKAMEGFFIHPSDFKSQHYEHTEL
ncbi:stromal cell-derived factor 2-like isoform X1 [Belonocnema kinseyi]|uniref:stromal cell-derived factor 2-like isoform X1 n=1 Tax=Belonocnema kinseyi TaxID=2817044 RepID=UPI00143D70DD|nr:stromal cell-derived factor 2-like isoform X1 [Belonocnema kinseyi]